ncbi:hypothetical protein T265_10326 [Opisthorchis viverrini]|uniref:Uncharacterized protein n=1 Tax=Opisthorchis viverrini TaxID=6198 RepID=A0A075A1P7_OPIVI|nr:hypothetical protein T265_10326 [Opisthorchis viverrini]KER21324.1 hypothetical protein T265_10326 [Opisthorchis viverrini]
MLRTTKSAGVQLDDQLKSSYLANVMSFEGSTSSEILLGCPGLDRSSQNAEVRFEPRSFRSVSLCLEHGAISHPGGERERERETNMREKTHKISLGLIQVTNLIISVRDISVDNDASLLYDHEVRLIIHKALEREPSADYVEYSEVPKPPSAQSDNLERTPLTSISRHFLKCLQSTTGGVPATPSWKNIRLTETRGLRVPDVPQKWRNRPWAVEEFSATL